MINGYTDIFLDTGWYMESTIYYNGFIYWCEAQTNSDTGITHFFVDRWKATTSDNILYNEYRNEGKLVDYSTVYEAYDKDMDVLKKKFIEAPIFDGKSFWQVEKEIAWLDEGEPICI